MTDSELLEKALQSCKWIGDFVCTSNDGGGAWRAVRDQRGSKNWSITLREVWQEINKRERK